MSDGCKRGSVPIVILALACASCGTPERASGSPEGRQTCLESVAAMALSNPRTNPLAANFAGPLGLVPSSDPNAPPYMSKQVEMPTRDGSVHYFAVDTARWAKAVLMRLVPSQREAEVFLYVIDRNGTLLDAGHLESRRFARLDIHDAGVRRNAEAERSLWMAAGPADSCRSRR